MSQSSFAFSVFGNRYFFTPKFIFLSLLLIVLLVGLGIWEIQKAQTVEETIQLLNQRMTLDPLQANDLESDRDLRFYPIELTGSFDNEHSILLPNRVNKGQRGYEVLTPFNIVDSSTNILIDRGWIPLNADANSLPEIQSVPDKQATITGMLYKPLNYFKFGSDFNENNVQWPLVSKHANIESLATALNTPLYPYIVLLSPSNQYGFVREWTWLPNSIESDRSRALAKQWFVLAFIVFMIFVFTNIHRI